MPNLSASWKAAPPISLVETSGERDGGDGIHHRVDQSRCEVGGAGPEVAQQTPGLPVARA